MYEQRRKTCVLCSASSAYFATFTPRVKMRKHLPKVNIKTLEQCYWPCFQVPLLLTLNRYLTKRKNKWTRTQNHLVLKRTLNHLAIWSPSDFLPASSKKFLDIQATIECGFTLKRVRDMTRT